MDSDFEGVYQKGLERYRAASPKSSRKIREESTLHMMKTRLHLDKNNLRTLVTASAYEIYEARRRLGINGTAEEDWDNAQYELARKVIPDLELAYIAENQRIK